MLAIVDLSTRQEEHAVSDAVIHQLTSPGLLHPITSLHLPFRHNHDHSTRLMSSRQSHNVGLSGTEVGQHCRRVPDSSTSVVFGVSPRSNHQLPSSL